jgi:methyl-accepting chemotaxis protein
MRIRSLVLLCFIAVAVPGVVASGLLMLSTLAALRNSQTAEVNVAAVGALQRAQLGFAMETGPLTAAFASEAPDVATLERVRLATINLLAEAERIGTAAGLDISLLREDAAALQLVRDRLAALLRQPVAARDRGFLADLLAARAHHGDVASRLAATAAQHVAQTAPALAPLVELATQVMQLRDYLGRRNLLLYGWMVSSQITAEQLAMATEHSGRVAQTWDNILRQTANQENNPRIAEERVRQIAGFAERDEPHWRRLLDVARARVAHPDNPPAWPEEAAATQDWANPAQASILALRDAALDQATAGARAMADAARWRAPLILVLAAVVMAVSLGAVLILLKRVVAPVRAVTGAIERIAAGELSVPVPGAARRDELGQMAAAMEILRAGSLDRAALQAAQAAEQEVKVVRAAKLESLVRNFEADVGAMTGAVATASTKLERTARTMASTASQTNEQAGAVAQAAEEASVGVQTVASAAEQLTSSIDEISRQVTQSARMTGTAAEDARRTDTVVRALAEAAQKIGDIVDLISSIAGQTNLLALNATIEAARAGDAGKGFAVVASEVKNLAQQTARATDDISAQISQIRTATQQAVEAIRGIGGTIEGISAIATTIASSVEEQGAATSEIARNIQQTSASTRLVTTNISGVSQAAAETGSAASQVLGSAAELSRQAESLSQAVGSFVAGVRAA